MYQTTRFWSLGVVVVVHHEVHLAIWHRSELQVGNCESTSQVPPKGLLPSSTVLSKLLNDE